MSTRGSGLSWYLRRLRVMGPAELLHRVHEQWAINRLRVSQAVGLHRRAATDTPDRYRFCASPSPQLPELPWAGETDQAIVDQILSGRVTALGASWQWRDDPAVWRQAPDTGRTWPEAFFSAIPYRAGNPYGDARVVWEPSRLQHLIPLGLLARRTDQTGRQAAELLARQIVSWAAANPPYSGVHYISAMECGLRIMAACHAVDLARGWFRDATALWSALLTVVESHARLIAARLSQYSSAGNHTLAECAGLIYAGALFPEFPDASVWLATGTATLEHEAPRQILPDGGGLEQAWWYLAFDVDLCGLVAAVLRHHGRVSPVIRYAHTRGRDFLREVAGNYASLPAIGDADSGFALSPWLRLCWPDQRQVDRIPPGLRTFQDTGYSLIRAERDVMIVDHGRLGMPRLYAHGHADALSAVLRRSGCDVLIDPGTYTYTGDLAWRRYFRGTRAHNTVTVDHQDQAVQEGPFQWSSPYASELVRSEQRTDGSVALLMRHDGYRRLGVEHWRGVSYQPSRGWVVWDYLAGTGDHRLDLHWHLGVETERCADGVRLPGLAPPGRLVVSGGDITLLRGETSPISGWRSRSYGHKEPCSTVRASFEGALPHEFVTRLVNDEGVSGSHHEEAAARFRLWIEQVQQRIFNTAPTKS